MTHMGWRRCWRLVVYRFCLPGLRAARARQTDGGLRTRGGESGAAVRLAAAGTKVSIAGRIDVVVTDDTAHR